MPRKAKLGIEPLRVESLSELGKTEPLRDDFTGEPIPQIAGALEIAVDHRGVEEITRVEQLKLKRSLLVRTGLMRGINPLADRPSLAPPSIPGQRVIAVIGDSALTVPIKPNPLRRI